MKIQKLSVFLTLVLSFIVTTGAWAHQKSALRGYYCSSQSNPGRMVVLAPLDTNSYMADVLLARNGASFKFNDVKLQPPKMPLVPGSPALYVTTDFKLSVVTQKPGKTYAKLTVGSLNIKDELFSCN